MKHVGWKIVFGVSWIPGLWIYGNLANCLTSMGGEGTEAAAGKLGFIILVIPSILFLGAQTGLGYLAFRK